MVSNTMYNFNLLNFAIALDVKNIFELMMYLDSH